MEKNQLMVEFAKECKKFAATYKVAQKVKKALKHMNFLCKQPNRIAKAEFLRSNCTYRHVKIDCFYYDTDDSEFKFENDFELDFPIISNKKKAALDNTHRIMTSVIQFLVSEECEHEDVVKTALSN